MGLERRRRSPVAGNRVSLGSLTREYVRYGTDRPWHYLDFASFVADENDQARESHGRMTTRMNNIGRMTTAQDAGLLDHERAGYKNLFLAALPARDLSLIEPLLQPIELRQGDVLQEPGQRVSEVVFVQSGVISLLTPMQDGAAIEIATLGREAVLGVLTALGSHRSTARATVQIGGTAFIIRASDFRETVDRSRILRHLVLLSSELAIAQVQQIAACNALHPAEQRLCRWILQVRDRTDSDVIQLTQDFLARMLAVRRPTVTLIAQSLQSAGLIRYRRGRITIADREGLEKLTCECVGEIRAKTRNILADLK
ncbi:MAG TPA: Crp/Fnr family transcriptional regulator [Reyranella sp.]|nr:Crp/Fnr family transcriptional regulator [Reyranella sp.]